jgi:hypothetical protein
MAPPLRSIVIRPRRNRKTYVFANTGYMGMPGTGMKTMTPGQWRKWSAKRDMKIVMRPNASSGPSRSRAVNEATRPRRGKSGRDEAGRGATRQAGIGRALPTGWSGRDEVGRGPPGPRLVPGPAPRSQLYDSRNTDNAAFAGPELDIPGIPVNDLLAALPKPAQDARDVLTRDGLRAAVRDIIVERMSQSPSLTCLPDADDITQMLQEPVHPSRSCQGSTTRRYLPPAT